MQDLLTHAAAMLRKREAGCLVTVVSVSGSAPGKIGAKMLVRCDGTIEGTVGGGRLEKQITEDAISLATGTGDCVIGTYRLGAALGMCCGGTTEVLLEPLRPAKRLFLFGGGHVHLAVASVARTAGFEVHVVDEREAFASPERFPLDSVHHGDALAALPSLGIAPPDFVVIATHRHELDQDILVALAPRGLAYLGVIGSKRKAIRALDRLRFEGLDEDVCAAVHTPIGLDIGAVTPGEIAVSVVAELVAVRRRPSGVQGDEPVSHMRVRPSADEAVGQVTVHAAS